MTSRERLMCIFKGDIPDRSAILLGGIPDEILPHPGYQPVHDLAKKVCDLRVSAYSPFDIYCGSANARISRTEVRNTSSPDWEDVHTYLKTPEGELHAVFTRSTKKQPGYEKEYLLKEPEDIRKLLSIPYEPLPFQPEVFRKRNAFIGELGIVMYGLDHAMFSLQRLIGSENFAIWSIECRDLMLEAVRVFSARIRVQASHALDHGLGPIFGWVGPEVCIPPLMSPANFEEFVFQMDKPLIDFIHERGGRVWVHCHGKMGPVLERFMEMGVDVLNPLEPPPMGDITLKEAFSRVDNRMGLEGNIETHELMTSSSDYVRQLVREALDAGRGHRFILCPSSGYAHQVPPELQYLDNLLAYLHEASNSV